MAQIHMEASGTLAWFSRFSAQLPFAISLALNRTADAFQEAERQGIQSRFQVRRAQFILRTVKIPNHLRATKAKRSVTIIIDPERDHLAKFEAGLPKRPQRGRHLAIPLETTKGASGIVPKAKRPRNLARTFTIPLRDGRMLLAQRVGRGPGKRGKSLKQGARRQGGGEARRGRKRRPTGRGTRVNVLYVLQVQAPTPRTLLFEQTFYSTVPNEWPKQLQRAWAHAVATAR